MEKKLSEMSLEELWQMIPIFLTGHKDCWEEWYNQEGGTGKDTAERKAGADQPYREYIDYRDLGKAHY